MSDLALVFSTFNPPRSLVETVRLLSERYPIVVVDDGGTDPHDVLPALAETGAHVVRQPRNSGIAAALNVGCTIALDDGAELVVTFDQDSTPLPETIETLRTSYLQAAHDGLPIAGIVPKQFAQVQQSRSDAQHAVARRVIQSGMLMPSSALEALGLFDESLFIDLVDTDYEMRALSRGFRILAAPTRIEHELGSPVRLAPFAPLPPTIPTMASTPFRYYYRVRNRIVLTRRYFRTAPGRMTTDLFIDLVYFALIALAARPRRSMLNVILRGARDGFRRRGGRAPDVVYATASRITWSVAE
ncbi:glycosyltransferase [Microbacterium sp.]|uniref:glycosyltransferase n=1 Tax=Microbacterium sp. TaxID=51671 RepID=UPI002FE31573